MKAFQPRRGLTVLFAAAALFLAGCMSYTEIQSIPTGAKVYVNDEIYGETPVMLSDNRVIGTGYLLRIEKEGYQPFRTRITRTEEVDAGPVVAGFLFTPVWWLWAMKYKPVHLYELTPAGQ